MSVLHESTDAAHVKVLRMTRTFDAPRDLVYQAWIAPEHLAKWWGPKCFTNPRCEADPRPGGAIRIDMQAPDGTVYPMGGKFHELVVPELIVFTSTAFEDENGDPLLEVFNTVTFEDVDGKTRLTVEARVVHAAPEMATALSGMEQGWSESLEKLGDLHDSADREIAVIRSFDAPRSTVWRAWTDPEQIVRWWGPNGFTTTMQEMDVRPGGNWRFIMHGPDGTDYRNEARYVEVVEPVRIVYDHFAPNFQSTATFVEAGDRTIVTVRMLFENAALRNQIAEKFGAVEGLKQTLGRLGEFVAAQ